MNIIAYLGLKIFSINAKAFEKATADPAGAQSKTLFEYLARNKNTEYGVKYNFSGIRSIDDYRRAVPLSNSKTMRPYLERMGRGELNILTADKPIFFGATSGTTNIPKLIPSTRYSDAKKSELLTTWGYYILRDHPSVFNGKILAIVSPEIEGVMESGIKFGGESGHGYRNLSWFVRHFYVLPHQVFQITDYDARYYTILRISMEHNITTIATLNPHSIVLVCQKIKKWADTLINDIEKGTLNSELNIPDDIRKKISKSFKPNLARANELKRILSDKGELLPADLWPGMELIECWKGGTMKMYLKELELYFGNIPVRDMGCLSTEARSSITMSDEGAGGVLAIRTNFFEFIPKEDIDKEKRTLLCGELEVGRDYYLVVTTPGGLYRYNIDDIIRVNGFFNNTPVIEFIEKGHNATSMAGEKFYESQVDEALNKALDRNKLLIKFFCAIAEHDKIPHYAFLAEFSGAPSPLEKKNFLRDIEEELYRQNREYEYVRNAQLLGAPVLKVVKSGDFEKYRAKRITEGAHDGQFKTLELTSDTDFEKNFTIEEEFHLRDGIDSY